MLHFTAFYSFVLRKSSQSRDPASDMRHLETEIHGVLTDALSVLIKRILHMHVMHSCCVMLVCAGPVSFAPSGRHTLHVNRSKHI